MSNSALQALRSNLATVLTGLAVASLLALSPVAFAQTDAAAALPQQPIPCDGVQQDQASCVREAGAARQEAQRGGLTSAPASTYAANALARCQLQPPADRADCEARIQGTGMSSTEGSVLGGGMIRETVTPVPASEAAR